MNWLLEPQSVEILLMENDMEKQQPMMREIIELIVSVAFLLGLLFLVAAISTGG
jgi:hypothetical protein